MSTKANLAEALARAAKRNADELGTVSVKGYGDVSSDTAQSFLKIAAEEVISEIGSPNLLKAAGELTDNTQTLLREAVETQIQRLATLGEVPPHKLLSVRDDYMKALSENITSSLDETLDAVKGNVTETAEAATRQLDKAAAELSGSPSDVLAKIRQEAGSKARELDVTSRMDQLQESLGDRVVDSIDETLRTPNAIMEQIRNGGNVTTDHLTSLENYFKTVNKGEAKPFMKTEDLNGWGRAGVGTLNTTVSGLRSLAGFATTPFRTVRDALYASTGFHTATTAATLTAVLTYGGIANIGSYGAKDLDADGNGIAEFGGLRHTFLSTVASPFGLHETEQEFMSRINEHLEATNQSMGNLLLASNDFLERSEKAWLIQINNSSVAASEAEQRTAFETERAEQTAFVLDKSGEQQEALVRQTLDSSRGHELTAITADFNRLVLQGNDASPLATAFDTIVKGYSNKNGYAGRLHQTEWAEMHKDPEMAKMYEQDFSEEQKQAYTKFAELHYNH